MSGFSNTTYSTSFDQTRSPMTSSNLGAPSTLLSPGTFKTNVHRAKSKRWTEAKTVDYGGGGWGDDDDFDDDDDNDEYSTGLGRRNSFDRGDDGLSPTIGASGNGSVIPRINVGIAQPLPPTPLELEQRERELLEQSPPPHPQHQYPMQPKPQLSTLPRIVPPTASPAQMPPLRVYGGTPVIPPGSYPHLKELPQPPPDDVTPPPPVEGAVKNKVPPPLSVSPEVPVTAPPPPPPSKADISGRDIVPPPLGMGPGRSLSPPPTQNTQAAGQSYELVDVQEMLPSIYKELPPPPDADPTRPMSWPSPPPQMLPEAEQEYLAMVQAQPSLESAGNVSEPTPIPSPPPSPPEDMEMSVSDENNGASLEEIGFNDRAYSLAPDVNISSQGHEHDDCGVGGRQFEPVNTSQVKGSSLSPSPDPVVYRGSSPRSNAPSGSEEEFLHPAEVEVTVNQYSEEDGLHEESVGQGVGAGGYPEGGIMSSRVGVNSARGSPTASLPNTERDYEPRGGSSRSDSRLSGRGDSTSRSHSSSPPLSRNDSCSTPRQDSPSAPSNYPTPAGASQNVPESPAVVQNYQHQFDTVFTGEEGGDKSDRTSRYWNDDIISGYATNSPVGSQRTASFSAPPPALVSGVSSAPALESSGSTPDREGSSPQAEVQRSEIGGFMSMVHHAFTEQDSLLPTPVSPHGGAAYTPPGDIISPILPREIPLSKSPPPPIVRAPVAPPKSSSPSFPSTPIPPPKSPTPPPKPPTPPGALSRLGTPPLVFGIGPVRSSSPRNSIGPERSATPVVPPIVTDGVEAVLDQVTPDTAFPTIENAEGPTLPGTWIPTPGAEIKQEESHEGYAGNSTARSPEKGELDQFLGELVRAHTPAPPGQSPSPLPTSSSASVEEETESQAQSIIQQEPQLQRPETPPQPPLFEAQEIKRESVGVLSFYENYWTEEEEAATLPPPIQPRNPRRPSAALETQVVRQELELLAHQSESTSVFDPNTQSFVPSHPTISPPTPELKRTGITLPSVTIPENNISSDPALMTPASALETPDNELMDMMIARKHYLARTQTGLSAKSDTSGRRIGDDDVMLRVKGDEMMFEKPDDIAVEPMGRAKEVIIKSESETGSHTESSDVIAPARVLGPESEGIEAIGGPTSVPRKEPPTHEDDGGEKTPMQSDFARELVHQFSRPQTLMLKDTMPMPSGLLIMPPMPPKEAGEEDSPEVVDFSKDDDDRDGDEDPVTPDAMRANLSQLDKPTTQESKSVDTGKTSQYMDPKDIAGLPNPHDRTAAYNESSKAIAQANTGLGNWINWMMEKNEGEDLLGLRVEQAPSTLISGKSPRQNYGGPSVHTGHQLNQQWAAPPVPPANATRALQNTEPPDDLGAMPGAQPSSSSTGPHVSPVVDKAKGFFQRLGKRDQKEAQDASLLSPGQQSGPSSTPGSLRTPSSSGSFQDSFTVSGLIGAPPANGNQKQIPHGQLQQTQSMRHYQGQPAQPLPPPQQRDYQPPTSPPAGQGSPQERGNEKEQPDVPDLTGLQNQEESSQPNFTERFPNASPPPPPPPPVKDHPPRLVIPGQYQQKTFQGHPVAHPQLVDDMSNRGPPSRQQDTQVAKDLPSESGRSAPFPRGSQESTGPSQSPPLNTPFPGHSAQNQETPPVSRYPFPRRTDSLRSQRQKPVAASPTVQTPGRADSLTIVHERFPLYLQQQQRTRADSLNFQEHGQPGRSDSISSSTVDGPIHPTRLDSLLGSHSSHSQPREASPPWSPSPHASALGQGTQRYQVPVQNKEPSPFPSAQRFHPQEPNSMARSQSDRIPLHPDGQYSRDHAGVERSQSYHLGSYPTSESQQKSFIHDRPRDHPQPIREDPPTAGPGDDDDLYAPPRPREQKPPASSGSGGPGLLPRQFLGETSQEQRHGPGQTGSPYPRQDLQAPPTRTSPEAQQPRQLQEHAMQTPHQTPPVPDYRISLPERQYSVPGAYQLMQPGVPNYPDRYSPGFQPRVAGYQHAQNPQPPGMTSQQGHLPQAIGAPGSLLRQQNHPHPEPDSALKRGSSGPAKTLSNVSGNRQSTDTGSFDPQGRNSQPQYEPSTTSSQEKRRSSFFGSLSAIPGKPKNASPSPSAEPKTTGKPEKRGGSLLKLRRGDGKKSEMKKEKKSSGSSGGKSGHKKGFSDVFGRTGSMLGKLSKSSTPAPAQQQTQPLKSPGQFGPQQRQPQSIDPRGLQVGPQNQSAYVANMGLYYPPPQQSQPPPGPSAGNWNSAQQQQSTYPPITGAQSPPRIKAQELFGPQHQPQIDSQVPRYDPVPIPTGYGRPQGEFKGAYIQGHPPIVQNQQPPQLQQPQRYSTAFGQQVSTQEAPGLRADEKAPTGQGYDSGQRLSADYRPSPELSRQSTLSSRVQGVPPPLASGLSRQGTQASHTRSASPQISNIDAHSLRNAPMSSVSEDPTAARTELSRVSGSTIHSEGERSPPAEYRSPSHLSPKSSLRVSGQPQHPPSLTNTPPPQLVYPVASPVGQQHAAIQMENGAIRQDPPSQLEEAPMALPPVPAKVPRTPPLVTSALVADQETKPQSPVLTHPPPQLTPSPSPAEEGRDKPAYTFYADASESSRVNTPIARTDSPQKTPPILDYSEKIAIQDGVEVTPKEDESDGEPVMSATSYPGQAWDPSYYGW